MPYTISSFLFLICTFLGVCYLYYLIRKIVPSSNWKYWFLGCITWLILQGIIAKTGIYKSDINAFPPKLFILGLWPILLFLLFLFFKNKSSDTWLENVSIRVLLLVHLIRIPVEIVLFLLYQSHQIPKEMTFEGLNFDILSGLSAAVLLIYYKRVPMNYNILKVWNWLALALLFTIILLAILSFPFEYQKFGFDQPNRAVVILPFIWLPTFVVPLVLFSHLAIFKKIKSMK